jgi:excinuclease ABC subunit A
MGENSDRIRIEGARQNNLKNLTLDLPLNKLIVLTGLSGSGKSSLAFDTLYAEGQRRYAETFSPYARQFLERMQKPNVDRIVGIPPAIAIGQVNQVRTSRSTVGTMTEIADHLKLLFHHHAELTCPHCQRIVRAWSPDQIADHLQKTEKTERLLIGFEVEFPKKAGLHERVQFIGAQGYRRLLMNDKVVRVEDLEKEKNISEPAWQIVQDRVTRTDKKRLLEALSQAFQFGKGVIWTLSEGEPFTEAQRFSDRWYCPYDRTEFDPPSLGLFSFNNPVGACPTCRGFGRSVEIDYDLALPDRSLSIAQGVVKPFQTASFNECQRDLMRACKRVNVPTNIPFADLKQEHQRFVIEREKKEGGWYGVKGFFDWLETRTYKMHVRVLLSRYRAYRTCPACDGNRYQPKVSWWRVGGKTLPELNNLPIDELLACVQKFKLPKDNHAYVQIVSRLNFLNQVGLGYLTLNRTTRTLSGGEFQRVNLTTCLGTSLVGTLFVLDEPSIGLHPRDTNRLIGILKTLRDHGNTVLVVEHDEAMIQSADHILELGPKQGAQGGKIMYQGDRKNLLLSTQSITGRYLQGLEKISIPAKRRTASGKLNLKGASKHNIHRQNFSIPLGQFVVITGVSGSGKSTLVHEIIYKSLQQHLRRPVDEPPQIDSMQGADQIADVILVDQSPLAQTPRSTPALYLDVYDTIRELFARSEDAQRGGLSASSFSFNSGTGRCERCNGMGFEKVSMQFLSDLFVPCAVCEGKRFQPHVLAVRYRGKSIHNVLQLTITEALTFFNQDNNDIKGENYLCARIVESLKWLEDVGLGYLQLGQPLNQLSGGEAQRLKLVGHLAQKLSTAASGKKTKLLILDEPTTGLHLDDVRVLVNILQRLVDAGNSLLVIEHHLDVMKCADWIIDLGPEAGEHGGRVVAEGTPAQIISNPQSITGKFLAEKLKSRKQTKSVKEEKTFLTYRAKTKPENISIHGARHHNLKNISLDIPRRQMVVITGLSGSGKSTLAFDLLFSEGQRRYLDCLNSYARQFIEQMEKPDVDAITGIPPSVAIEQRTSRGGGKSTVATVTELYQFMRLLYAKLGTQHDPQTGEQAVRQTVDEILKRIRKQNKRDGRLKLIAPLIRGRKGFHKEVVGWARRHNIDQLRIDGKWMDIDSFKALDRYREHMIDALIGSIDSQTRQFENLVRDAVKHGQGTLITQDTKGRETIYSTELFCPGTGRSFEPLDPRLFSFNSPHGWCLECKGYGTVLKINADGDTEAEREQSIEQQIENHENEIEWIPCASCHGARLNEIARSVRFKGKTIIEINQMTVSDFETFFKKLKWTDREKLIVSDIRPEVEQRLKFLQRVGLGYLNMSRSAPTLSGGEAQRIRLAAQLGSNLQGVLYVLDEPTIGLHPRDNEQLLIALRELQQRGNSLVVVEHDEDTMREADHIIDLGPAAGINGGEILAQGSWDEISRHEKSVTGLLLGNPMPHPLHGTRRPIPKNHPHLQIIGARANNLKKIDVSIPLNRLVSLCGVSGSGKSTLMREVLLPALKKSTSKIKTKESKNSSHPWSTIRGHESIDGVVEIDQSPIGKTSRSTVSTYVGIMDTLRELFARTPEAQVRGLTASDFSFNNGKGRCPTCKGQGTVKLEMNFLPPSFIPCEACDGKRWMQHVLEVRYRERNILDILNLSIDEALPVFDPIPRLALPLKLLQETGLGYLKLGQTSPTLSGGEAQRIKLVTELIRAQLIQQKALMRSRTGTRLHYFYLLEEPTVGLHLADVKRLIDMFHRLVNEGNTVLVIEHHLDIIAEADHVIELGPESGELGGHLIFTGLPEELIQNKQSPTARFLHPILKREKNKTHALKNLIKTPA